jgi:hypothetical protein
MQAADAAAFARAVEDQTYALPHLLSWLALEAYVWLNDEGHTGCPHTLSQLLELRHTQRCTKVRHGYGVAIHLVAGSICSSSSSSSRSSGQLHYQHAYMLLHQARHRHWIAVNLVAGSICSSGQRSGGRQAGSAKAQIAAERHVAEQLVYGARNQHHISGCVHNIHELRCSLRGFDVAAVAEHHEQQQYLHSCCTR